MVEFEQRQPIIDSDPRRAGSLVFRGILIKRGKHIPWSERSVEARQIVENNLKNLLEELKEIDDDFGQVGIFIETLSEEYGRALETELKNGKIGKALVQRRRAMGARMECLLKEYDGDRKKAVIQLLVEAGLSPEYEPKERSVSTSEENLPPFLKRR